MYEVLNLPLASRMLQAIVTELNLEEDDEAFEDLETVTLLLETILFAWATRGRLPYTDWSLVGA